MCGKLNLFFKKVRVFSFNFKMAHDTPLLIFFDKKLSNGSLGCKVCNVRMYGFKLEGGEGFKEGFRKLFSLE